MYQLTQTEAEQGRPVRIQGVTTCVLSELRAIVVEDRTGALYVMDDLPQGELPPLGELVAIEGVTKPGMAVASVISRLGPGTLPDPQRPSWNQLMNGSMNCRWIEIRGVNESVIHRSNGWSRVSLRTKSGVLRVELRRAGVEPHRIQDSLNAVVTIRGCMFADWDVATQRVKSGQIRMHDAELVLEESATGDLFTTPHKTAASLLRYDPDVDDLQRVRVSGQIVFVRGNDYFVMDGGQGMRLLCESSLGLSIGDLVEAVGFPDWGYPSPCLRAVVARKTGEASLPDPVPVSPDDLMDLAHDASFVQVEGRLTSRRELPTETILEIESGSWRFIARVQQTQSRLAALQLGSRLQLRGIYSAQGGYRSLGADVVPIDLLIASPKDIRILFTPPWWTGERVIAVAGVLTFLLLASLLWVTQLRRKVEQRTAQLQLQIRNREQAEHARALERERARIAHDLHDELGADITEVGMLATRVRSLGSDAEEGRQCLAQAESKTAEMVSTLDEIVWATDPERDSLKSLASYFGFYADRLLGLADIRVRMTSRRVRDYSPVEANVRHQAYRVFKEALANVVTHSEAGEVRITIDFDDGCLSVRIEDDGCGFDLASPAVTLRNGIRNMRRRVEHLKGGFEVQSAPGAGTTIHFSMPLT